MVVYEFKCNECNKVYELDTRTTDKVCCDKPVKRVYSLSGIQFKGSGFYKTDNK